MGQTGSVGLQIAECQWCSSCSCSLVVDVPTAFCWNSPDKTPIFPQHKVSSVLFSSSWNMHLCPLLSFTANKDCDIYMGDNVLSCNNPSQTGSFEMHWSGKREYFVSECVFLFREGRGSPAAGQPPISFPPSAVWAGVQWDYWIRWLLKMSFSRGERASGVKLMRLNLFQAPLDASTEANAGTKLWPLNGTSS